MYGFSNRTFSNDLANSQARWGYRSLGLGDLAGAGAAQNIYPGQTWYVYPDDPLQYFYNQLQAAGGNQGNQNSSTVGACLWGYNSYFKQFRQRLRDYHCQITRRCESARESFDFINRYLEREF